MENLLILKERRSIRKFQEKEVPKEVIEDIIDCARFAATARNVQPWEFIIVCEAETRKELASITEYGKFIQQAPVCIVVLCKDTKYYLEDGCAATQNILIAAKAYGLGSCWVAGDKKPYARRICDILSAPEEYRLISLIAIGYPAETPSPSKRTVKDVLHWEKW